jgi:D-aminopeptidase
MAGNTSTFLPFTNVRIGHAHDPDVKTGVTVILPDEAALCSVDVRGGGPGTRETDTLAFGGLVDRVHAIVLSGGSVYGLAAADTVCRMLGAKGQGYVAGPPPIPVSPIVPSAILFDNANGGDKDWGETPPYAALGRDALLNASHETIEGAVGAGYGATAGTYAGGFGVATESVGTITVSAMIAANPVGSPYLPGTDVPHAWLYERVNEFGDVQPPPNYHWSPPTDTKLSRFARAGQNTVIGVVATNAALSSSDLKRLAIMAQDGLAMSVQPSHTPLDGDTIFTLSVGDESATGPAVLAELGAAAARAVARALTRGVLAAQ